MNIHHIKTTARLEEQMLGTMSGNEQLQTEHVISRVLKDKGQDLSKEEQQGRMDEEVKAQQQAVERYQQKKQELSPDVDPEESITKAMTMFPIDDTGLYIWDYQIRGFYKEALKALVDTRDVKSVTTYTVARAIDNFVMVYPRRIYLCDPEGKPLKEAGAVFQRPLRAQTMRGERVALAASVTVPAGTTLVWETKIFMTPAKVKAPKPDDIMQALDYGQFKGLGQWRGGGWGRFTHHTDVISAGKGVVDPEKE